MATAGLRRLEPNVASSILASCRAELLHSPFRFQEAAIITGVWEGLYAWVAANYALGTLGKSAEETVGIVELGGASAQVTFVPEDLPPAAFRQDLMLAGSTYHLYSHSFLNFGQEAAAEGVSELLVRTGTREGDMAVTLDPCKPRGYNEPAEDGSGRLIVTAAGNFSSCRNSALQLLKIGQESCPHKHCGIGSIFVPELRGLFFATENFYHTAVVVIVWLPRSRNIKTLISFACLTFVACMDATDTRMPNTPAVHFQFLKLGEMATLQDVEEAGRSFCEADWQKLQVRHAKVGPADLLRFCFSAAYTVALLHDALGIPMHDTRLRFTNRVGAVPVDWALGALIVELAEAGRLQESASLVVSVLACLFLVLGVVGLASLWSCRRARRPHVTTIFDLEKGRYFTTTSRAYR
eukprot:SM000355S13187  [mRNA]  locus=s355:64495:66430:+ [translate_table: standard]